MAVFARSAATLRFFGDAFVPDEVTALLGCPPTRSARKGEVFVGKTTGQAVVAKTGRWTLSASDESPEGLDRQIEQLLAVTSNDLRVWQDLTTKYQADLFCGLFMSSGNDGFNLSASTLLALGSRGLKICLDVYGRSED